MERSVHNGGRERAQSHWPCKSQNFREIAEFFRVVEKIADAVAWDKWNTADAKRLASTLPELNCTRCRKTWRDLYWVRDELLQKEGAPCSWSIKTLRWYMTNHVSALMINPEFKGDRNVYFMHDRINAEFGHGGHRGSSVDKLTEEIVYAYKAARGTSPHLKMDVVLDVVWLHNKYYSFNNRRLFALWAAADELDKPLKVQVNCHPLLEHYEYAVAPEEDGGDKE